MSFRYLFGPISSRRLGISLGVDLIPYKYCPLDCVYCEVQSTKNHTIERQHFYPPQEIIGELDKVLSNHPQIDYITFSGAGEPTLFLGIKEIIDFLKTRYPTYKIALITNSVLFTDPRVRVDVKDSDVVLPSLDAVSQDVFEKINRPLAGLKAQDLVSGLCNFREGYRGQIWLEVFIVPGANDHEEEILKIGKAIQNIKPDRVQINSLDRPGTEAWVKAASIASLDKIKELLSVNSSSLVEIIAKDKLESYSAKMDEDLIDKIRSILSRRPCTLEDLDLILKIHVNELSKLLRQLIIDKQVSAQRTGSGVFYSWKS